MSSCIFCAITAGVQPAKVVLDNVDFLCFLPLDQEVPGHTLIVSKAHYASLLDAPPHIGTSLIEVCQSLVQIYSNSMGATSFNLLSANGADAQQSVWHLHLHFLPRKPMDAINAWPQLLGSTT